jgi:hypothetical protein
MKYCVPVQLFFIFYKAQANVDNFIDDDIILNPGPFGLRDNFQSQIVHILIEGVDTPLEPTEIQFVNNAFKDAYNTIFHGEGFVMDSVSVVEQHLHGSLLKFVQKKNQTFELKSELQSFITLVTSLQGTSPTNLHAYGDAEYLALMRRQWESRACQIVMTGKYKRDDFVACYMVSPPRARPTQYSKFNDLWTVID